MDPSVPKNVIDWDASDLTTLIDTGTEDQLDEMPNHQRYEDLDHQSLEVRRKISQKGLKIGPFRCSSRKI